MSDIEIMRALYLRLKFEQNLGLDYLPRNLKFTQEVKKLRAEQLHASKFKMNSPQTKKGDVEIKTSPDKVSKMADVKSERNVKSLVNSDVVEVLPESGIDKSVQENQPNINKEENMGKNSDEKEVKLKNLVARILACHQCKELSETRDKIVPGAGNINSPLMFIGEAPGADENREGIPFIGRAGKKLTEIIEKGMKIPRDQVYITNVLKCRPPRNRDPKPDEIAFCEPFLRELIEIMQPRIIFTLGAYAARFMLEKPPTYALAKIRGTIHQYRDTNIKIAATYHPSYLIQYYTKVNRQKVFDDTQMVLKFLHDEGLYPWWAE